MGRGEVGRGEMGINLPRPTRVADLTRLLYEALGRRPDPVIVRGLGSPT